MKTYIITNQNTRHSMAVTTDKDLVFMCRLAIEMTSLGSGWHTVQVAK